MRTVLNSNTTLVKVKFKVLAPETVNYQDSNTTLVKVKSTYSIL